MDTQARANEVTDRGMDMFETHIKGQVAGLNPDAFLAIDVDTGDFEVSDDDIQIFHALRVRRPNAVIFLRRIGDASAYFMGGGSV